MADLLLREEHVQFLELLRDDRIPLPHRLALQPLGHGGVEPAVGQDGAIDLDAVVDTGVIIVFAVPGRGVDQARAISRGHVFRVNDLAGPVHERMLILDAD